MTLLSRFQQWLSSPRVVIPVDVQCERFVYLNVHARPVMREALQRNLIEDQPDTWPKPLNYDEDGLPNG